MKNKMIFTVLLSLTVSSIPAIEAAAATRPGLLGVLDQADGALAEILSADAGGLQVQLEKPMSDLADRLRATRLIVAEASHGAAFAPERGREVNVFTNPNHN